MELWQKTRVNGQKKEQYIETFIYSLAIKFFSEKKIENFIKP